MYRNKLLFLSSMVSNPKECRYNPNDFRPNKFQGFFPNHAKPEDYNPNRAQCFGLEKGETSFFVDPTDSFWLLINFV